MISKKNIYVITEIATEKLINKGIITIDKNILIHNTHMHSDTYLWPKKYSKKGECLSEKIC